MKSLILERTSKGNEVFDIEADLLRDRKIFISGEINQETATEFLKCMFELKKISAAEPVKIFINSPGGDVKAGLMIYDVIRGAGLPVETYCTGMAYSIAAVIFMAGTKWRGILENSSVMIHSPLVNGIRDGSTESIESLGRTLRETKDQLDGIISACTGKSREEVSEATSYDHYFTAAGAVEYGIADGIEKIGDIK